MVRTSKGPAEKSKPDKAVDDAPAVKQENVRPGDIDDATWDQIQSLARSQQTTTGQVIKRAIVAQFGVAQPQGALHSGMPTDPAKG